RELDQCRGAINLVPQAVEARLVARLAEAGILRRDSLPPMRDVSDTQTIALEKAKESLTREVSKLASMSPGPVDEVHAKPDTIAKVAIRVFEDAFAAREQAKEFARLRETEAAALRTKAQAAAYRSSLKKSVVAGVVTAAIIGFGTYLIGAARGHLEGVIEGKASAPVVTVPVPVPTPTPPALPAHAPASMAHP
ncbi:MAG TPA: hypothetical protein VIY73_16005, partial [Polyangiaceae bacterium]